MRSRDGRLLDRQQVVFDQLAVLAVRNPAQRIADPKAHHQEPGTAGHPEDRHQHPALVAPEVAQGRLVLKGQAPPHGRHVLQPQPRPALGGWWQEQLGRDFPGVLVEDPAGGQTSRAHGQPPRGQQPAPGKAQLQAADGRIGGVGRKNQARQKPKAARGANQGAARRRQRAVKQELLGDVKIRIAQSLESPDLLPLFGHEAGHRRQRHQDRHGKHKDRKDVGDQVNPCRIRPVDGVARVAFPGLHG